MKCLKTGVGGGGGVINQWIYRVHVACWFKLKFKHAKCLVKNVEWKIAGKTLKVKGEHGKSSLGSCACVCTREHRVIDPFFRGFSYRIYHHRFRIAFKNCRKVSAISVPKCSHWRIFTSKNFNSLPLEPNMRDRQNEYRNGGFLSQKLRT